MKLSFKNITATVKKLFSRYFTVINTLVVVITLGVGFYLVLSPSILRLRAGKSIGLEDRRKEVARLAQYLNDLENMKLDYKNFTQEKLNELKLILPREEDFPGLFVQMQELAKDNNFVLNSIDISYIGSGEAQDTEGEEGQDATSDNEVQVASTIDEITGGRVKELNMAFSVSGGDYDDLKNFLRDMERNIRIFDVYDIRFGSVEQGPYSLNVRTYYLAY